MTTKLSLKLYFGLLLSTLNLQLSTFAQGTAFTYQGRLNENGSPATGTYDLRFAIYDSPTGGNPTGNVITNSGVAVNDGLFALTLDFGANAFPGADRWLEIGVRTNGSNGAFDILAPLQALMPVPYAITANSASNLLGTVSATQVGGTLSPAQLPGEVLTNNQAGVNLSGSFTGNALGLTNLPVDSLVRITTNSALVAWGANNSGQAIVPTPLNGAKAVATGFEHNLVLKPDGTVFAWGGFGPATNVPAGLNNVVAVAGGLDHSVAVRADGTVTAWGENTFGQTNIPPNWTNIVAVAAGGEFNVALRNDGTVVARGRNQAGQTNVPPGLNGVAAVGAGFVHAAALKSNGTVVAWGDNNFGQTSVPAGLSNVVALAVGWTHNMALKADGRIVAWGLNDGGKTNVPVSLSNVVAMAAGMSHSLALRGDGRVIAWGGNSSGQTNVPAGLNNVIGLGVGPAANHSVALRNEVFSPVAWLDANNTFYALNTFNAGLQVNGTLRSSRAIVDSTVSANSFSGSGSGLTNLQAQNIVFGTLSDARLSANVALLDSSPAFSGQVSAGTGMRLNDSDLRLRSSGNFNGLGWYGAGKSFAGVDVNGPVLFGGAGGALGQFDARGETITLRWDTFNRVGIGRDAAANRLEVEGNASKTTSGNWLANSDARIKTGVRPVSGALEKLAQLRLVSFRYTDEYREKHPSIEQREYLNVIAQEFQRVFPEYVKRSGEKLPDGSEILQVDTHPLMIYSAAAVQELHALVKEKEMRNSNLEKRLAQLEAMVFPVSTRNCKSQAGDVRHLGPTAQDFKAAFGVGENDTTITTIDADGVALAAIQGLNEKVDSENTKLREELQRKDAEIAELRRAFAELAQLVKAKSAK